MTAPVPRVPGPAPPAGGRHLILVGLPGAGKTTVGPIVAAALGCPFLDFDTEIERRTGMAVSSIFRVRGEQAFRAMERELTRDVAGRPGMVLAPGGGWMGQEGNVALVRPPSRIVYLSVSVETALARLGEDIGSRPLLSGPAPREVLERLRDARTAVYGRADATMNTEGITAQQVADSVARLAYGWGWPIG